MPHSSHFLNRQREACRTDPNNNMARLLELEKLSIKLEMAIRFYTAGSAYSHRREHDLGQLAPGYSADFSIIDIDPFRDGLDTLQKAQNAVSETWVRGEQAYKR